MLFEKIQLEADEKIITTVRKHWFFLFSRTCGVLMTALLPLVGWILVSQFLQSDTIATTINIAPYTKHFSYLFLLWLLINWMSLAYIWTDHYLDTWTITDRRIIAVDQVSLFRRRTGSFRLEKLQDMNIEINGFIATILNFGIIEAQTASGSEEEFRANFIPKPQELKAIILRAADGRMYTTPSHEQNHKSEGL